MCDLQLHVMRLFVIVTFHDTHLIKCNFIKHNFHPVRYIQFFIRAMNISYYSFLLLDFKFSKNVIDDFDIFITVKRKMSIDGTEEDQQVRI